MAGFINFPSGGSPKGEFTFERYKVLEDGKKEFDCFLTSNNVNKYPDGEEKNGYFYQRTYAESQTVYMLKLSDTESVYANLDSQEPVTLTATANDIRLGTKAVSNNGVVDGEKEIPAYYSRYGSKIVSDNEEVVIKNSEYDFKSLMIHIASYNTKMSDSYSVNKASVGTELYEAKTTTKLADITIDYDNEQILVGITADEKCVVRYFLTREEH